MDVDRQLLEEVGKDKLKQWEELQSVQPVQNKRVLADNYDLQTGDRTAWSRLFLATRDGSGNVINPFWVTRSGCLVRGVEEDEEDDMYKEQKTLCDDRVPVYFNSQGILKHVDVSADIRGKMFKEPPYDKYLMDDIRKTMRVSSADCIQYGKCKYGNGANNMSNNIAKEAEDLTARLEKDFLPTLLNLEPLKRKCIVVTLGLDSKTDPHKVMLFDELTGKFRTENQKNMTTAQWTQEIVNRLKEGISRESDRLPSWARGMAHLTGWDTEGFLNLEYPSTRCRCRKASCSTVKTERIHVIIGDMYLTVLFPGRKANRVRGTYVPPREKTEGLSACSWTNYCKEFLVEFFAAMSVESGLIHCVQDATGERRTIDRLLEGLGILQELQSRSSSGDYKILLAEGNPLKGILRKLVATPVEQAGNTIKESSNAMQVWFIGGSAPDKMWQHNIAQGFGRYDTLSVEDTDSRLLLLFVYHYGDCSFARTSVWLGIMLAAFSNLYVVRKNLREEAEMAVNVFMELMVRAENGITGWRLKMTDYDSLPGFTIMLDEWAERDQFPMEFPETVNTLYGKEHILQNSTSPKQSKMPTLGGVVSSNIAGSAVPVKKVSSGSTTVPTTVSNRAPGGADWRNRDVGVYGVRQTVPGMFNNMSGYDSPTEEEEERYNSSLCYNKGKKQKVVNANAATVQPQVSAEPEVDKVKTQVPAKSMADNVQPGDVVVGLDDVNLTEKEVLNRVRKCGKDGKISLENREIVEEYLRKRVKKEVDDEKTRIEAEYNDKFSNDPEITQKTREIAEIDIFVTQNLVDVKKARVVVNEACAKLEALKKEGEQQAMRRVEANTDLHKAVGKVRRSAESEIENAKVKAGNRWKTVQDTLECYSAGPGEISKIVIVPQEEGRLPFSVKDTREVVLPNDEPEPWFVDSLRSKGIDWWSVAEMRYRVGKEVEKMVLVLSDDKVQSFMLRVKGTKMNSGMFQHYSSAMKGLPRQWVTWGDQVMVLVGWKRLVSLANRKEENILFQNFSAVLSEVCRRVLGVEPEESWTSAHIEDASLSTYELKKKVLGLSSGDFDKTLRKWLKKSTFAAIPQVPKSGPGAGGAKMQHVQTAHVKVDGATSMEVENEVEDEVEVEEENDDILEIDAEEIVEDFNREADLRQDDNLKFKKPGINSKKPEISSSNTQRNSRSYESNSRNQGSHGYSRRDKSRGQEGQREARGHRSDYGEQSSRHRGTDHGDRSRSRNQDHRERRDDGRRSPTRPASSSYGRYHDSRLIRSRTPQEQRDARK